MNSFLFLNSLFCMGVETHLCVTESLCYTPETNTTLSISYTPIENKVKMQRHYKHSLPPTCHVGSTPTHLRKQPLCCVVASLVAHQVSKESICNVGDCLQGRKPASVPGLGRSPGGERGSPLQCSCLENPMDRGARWAAVYGVARVGHDLATKPTPHFSYLSTEDFFIHRPENSNICCPALIQKCYHDIHTVLYDV